MGYYDSDHNSESRSRQKGNRGGMFLAGLLGVVLGAILVIVAIPQLTNFDILPYSIQPDEDLKETDDAYHNGATQNVSVDVTTDVTKAVEKAGDSVVGITNIQSQSFWGQGEGQTQDQQAGTGSGVMYKKEGSKVYIVTNNHVVEGADQLEVTLADGTKVPAEMRGADIWTDLAVIEIDGSKIKKDDIAEFGNSDKLKAGEPVIAIGNPLGLQFSGSVTQGVVSGVERTIPVDINQDGMEDWNAEVLQTDAAINPGNSGGALINISGQLIGINSMKIAQSAVEGIGLAIPINYAQPIIEDLEQYGEVKRPAMGVTLEDVNKISAYHQQETLKLPKEINYGVMIRQTVPNSPAAQAGLQELDVITELDGEKIENVIELRKHLYNKKDVNDQMKVTLYRNGEKKEVTMKLTDESRL
ncbi:MULTISPECIES: S1C family serine protease [Rossellomorea]|jgi:serine protease Do|uniref:PDZ domain-containing protein n=1 Tax=Rossellomorea aquimaris TaxID=189382 RepID=A0A5D4UCA9_9BACI|nr:MULTISPECIES: trypsin-like peptidase domain-containing protein [Rossellomorea]MDT9026591.1 trypsin-like peptidase domain-containing protein [Rossellomorea sp. YC4-1]TYS76133.1 PDZ domain-containing protein [Rossellomorea aquimaris]TYS82568.1 PDZ domain-containing protein [Rossellomorea aquimaris]TYS85036.1 PDZ domain-containing protein [Rossellomorea aquimaris]